MVFTYVRDTRQITIATSFAFFTAHLKEYRVIEGDKHVPPLARGISLCLLHKAKRCLRGWVGGWVGLSIIESSKNDIVYPKVPD